MLETITPSEMRQLETTAIHRFGISEDELMQRAARGVADAVEGCLSSTKGNILCYCGTGNNGGDGLAAVRYLLSHHKGLSATVYMLPRSFSPDCQREKERLEDFVRDGRVNYVASVPHPAGSLAVIDAIFGTGLNRSLDGDGLEAVKAINRCRELSIPVISVDIPSGLNGQTGRIMGDAVCADVTVTFHRPKTGLFIREGLDHAGKVLVRDIGLNLPELAPYAPKGWNVLEREDLKRLLPKRRRELHKGECGRLLLFAGSFGMAGAAAISATAALKTGAGLVTVACPEAIVPTVQTLCPCATCLPLPKDETAAELLTEALSRFDAVCAGCGIGRSDWAKTVLTALIAASSSQNLPLVLDADALNLLPDMEAFSHPCWFMTPHAGEAARLLNCTPEEIRNNPVCAAVSLRKEYAADIVLKGSCSLLMTEDGTALNPYGCAAMAKGGSGDALTGVIGALLAGRQAGLYQMTNLELLQCACALHGLAGMAAEAETGDRGLLATDLCTRLGLDY